jgi:hypothetical protein
MNKHPGSPSAPIKEQGQVRSAFDLHLAEYEALMMRNTYWITLQFSVAPAIALYFTLLATVWSGVKFVQPTVDLVAFQKTLLWIGLLGAEVFVLAGYSCLHEIFNNVRYIEKELRQELDPLVASKRYWMYEAFLAKHRGVGALVAECGATVAVWIAILLIYLKTHPLADRDGWLLAVDLAVAVLVSSKNMTVTRIRLAHFRK